MARKVWMITGASRGIGAEIARAALSAGDSVVATARDPQAMGDLGGAGGEMMALRMDVTDEGEVSAGAAEAIGRFGRIDVLVNNAGFGVLGAIEETPAGEVERVYRTNVFGLLNVVRAVLPSMRSRRAGHIINFSSLGGFRASPGWGIYCSTKFAVEGISEALHDELKPLGIRVTVVEPGYFRTDFLDPRSLVKTGSEIADYADTAGRTRQAALERNHRQPGDPAKLADAIVKIAAEPEPPLRLPLGSDALALIAAKNAFVEGETARWAVLSRSTDF